MTREEAIEEINKVFEPAFANYIITALTEGVTVSDKALEQQPCGDCISRQAVLETIEDCNNDGLKGIFCSYNDGKRFEAYIKELPPVTPKEKTGHWIFDEILDRHYYCSECKSMGVDYWDYCPECGAKMIEPQESEEI